MEFTECHAFSESALVAFLANLALFSIRRAPHAIRVRAGYEAKV